MKILFQGTMIFVLPMLIAPQVIAENANKPPQVSIAPLLGVNPNLIQRGQNQIHPNQAREARDAYEAAKNRANIPGVGNIDASNSTMTETGLGRVNNQGDLENLVGDGKDNSANGMGFIPNPTAPQNPEGNTPNGATGAPVGASSPRDVAGGLTSQDGSSDSQTTRYRHYGNGMLDWEGNISRPESPNTSNPAFMPPPTVEVNKDMETGESTKFTYGNEVQPLPQTNKPKTDPAGNPDPDNADPDGRWARYHAKLTGQSPDLGLKIPNRVNPGPDGATSDPKAPQLTVPQEQLVGDPSLSQSRQNSGGRIRQRVPADFDPSPGARPIGK